jgi:hypothetical protein
MYMPLETIFDEIAKAEWILFNKNQVRSFIQENSTTLDGDTTEAVFDDLWAFNAYLGRLEGYPSIDKIPYWEYSACLEWFQNHMMIGDSYDLNHKNAKRFLNNLRLYYEYVSTEGNTIDLSEINKAIKTICSGPKLKLVTEIPYTGAELYTEIYHGATKIRFDMADYWILVLHTCAFHERWPQLLEVSMSRSKERFSKVKELQAKLKSLGYKGLSDIAFNNVTENDMKQATKWFYNNQ